MITFRKMKFADAKEMILRVLPTTWKEIGDTDLPCEPHWNVYDLMEKNSLLFWVLAFDDEQFIGFAMVTIHPHMNSIHSIVSTIPSWWVAERPSRGLILRAMLNYCELLLANYPKTIEKLFVKTHPRLSAGRVLEAMGYEHVELSYSKPVRRKAEAA